VKKLILISGILLALFGCSQQHEEWNIPYPTTSDKILQRYITTGWGAYKRGDFSLAHARFDSAVKIASDNSDAYIGLGYSEMQLGSEDPSLYSRAISNFGFTLYLEGGNPIEEQKNYEDFGWGNITSDSLYYVMVANTDIIGLYKLIVNMVVYHIEGSAEVKDAELSLNVDRFTNNAIITSSVKVFETGIDPSDSSVFVPGNTYGGVTYDVHIYADIATTTLDEITGKAAVSLAGVSQIDQIKWKSSGKLEDDLLPSIIYARAFMNYYPETNPVQNDPELSYLDPAITSKNVHILLTQDYLYAGLYVNCLWELWKLDPDTKDPASPNYIDPTSSDFVYKLTRAVEGL